MISESPSTPESDVTCKEADAQVKYLSRNKGYSVYLTAGGMALSLRPTPEKVSPSPVIGAPRSQAPGRMQLPAAPPQVLNINLIGAAANPEIVGEQPLPTKINYFIGRDPIHWRRNVPTFGRIRYRSVYPGIDLIYYGSHHQLEFDFDVAWTVHFPCGDPPTAIQQYFRCIRSWAA